MSKVVFVYKGRKISFEELENIKNRNKPQPLVKDIDFTIIENFENNIPLIIPNPTYNSRLSVLNIINPKYAEKIEKFIISNPEFLRVGHLLSLTEYPVNYNRNPGESYNPHAPREILEHLVYYIACSGVRYSYALDQWRNIIRPFMENNNLRGINKNSENNVLKNLGNSESTVDLSGKNKIQPKKQEIYNGLHNLLQKYKIYPNYSLNYEQALKISKELKGVGQGWLTYLALFFGPETDILPDYTDLYFKKGFTKFYNLTNPTKKQILKISQGWSNIKIGNMFMHQCALYL
jgi:hypothetical protein